MWVRSQDKTRLLKASYIRVNDTCIEAIHSDMLCTLIGKYSTKEKALKVLDILETFIRGDFVTLLDGNYIKKIRDNFMWGTHDAQEFIRLMQKQVFQMPQDEEV